MEKEVNKVSFTQMKDGNYEDYQLLKKLEKPYLNLTASRILDELKRQGESTLEGYRLSRLDHGLQSATRAEADGVDIDWIIGALLHDIGDGLAPHNHDKFSAEVIRPLFSLGSYLDGGASWHLSNDLLCPSLRMG